MQSIIVLYIKETDGRPADGAIQSRIEWEEMEEDQGTPYTLRAERNWRKTKYADADRLHMTILYDVFKILFFLFHMQTRNEI